MTAFDQNAQAESAYAWLRLAASLALMTISGVGMYAVAVALPAVQAEFGIARSAASLPYAATMIGFGLGGIFGYKANRLLVTGQSFANTPTALDVFRPGRLVSPSDLQPFSVALQSFSATYVSSGPQLDEPQTFNAALRYSAAPNAPTRSYDLRVNHPLTVDSVSVYLIGHGYAPEFKVTDGHGNVVFSGPVPFIPVEQAINVYQVKVEPKDIFSFFDNCINEPPVS